MNDDESPYSIVSNLFLMSTTLSIILFSSPQQVGMLSLREGEIVKLENSDETDWWMVEKEGRKGWVPSAYVERV